MHDKDKSLENFFNNILYDDKEYKNILTLSNDDYLFEKGNNYKNKTSIINISEIITKDFPYIDFITKRIYYYTITDINIYKKINFPLKI